jgi:hypothetical protein
MQTNRTQYPVTSNYLSTSLLSTGPRSIGNIRIIDASHLDAVPS